MFPREITTWAGLQSVKVINYVYVLKGFNGRKINKVLIMAILIFAIIQPTCASKPGCKDFEKRLQQPNQTPKKGEIPQLKS